MEAISSSFAAADSNPVESVVDKTLIGSSEGGRKSNDLVADMVEMVEVTSDEESSDDLSSEEDYDSDEESEEEDFDEEEEENRERTRILEDMWKLKKLADFFQHPEKPVEVDAFSAGRSYFTRPDAFEGISEDEDEELVQALADAQALKKAARAYLHPEVPVEADSTACARNYFSQPWAAEQDTFGQAEERARLVGESMQLSKHAATYHHPEAPIDMELATAMGRNYFSRASAPEQEDDEERAQILAEAAALKKLAVDYLHPEKPVEIDATASGRNYFTRASAPEQEEDEYADERVIILEEMKEIKELSTQFMHPEKPIEMDPTASGRNYFTRATAPEQEEDEYADEREIILEEMKELKELSTQFMHPENPIQMDATASGRNYFSRASAPEQEDDDERAQVLAEAAALKKLAVDYLHPEKPVEMDPTTSGRNYFTRASAQEQEEDEYADEREIILEEIKELKDLSVQFMHPEKPIEMDAMTSGRNYFSRASAPEQEQDDDERAQVLAEAAALKKLAVDYLHPEQPVDMDPTTSGRNYFTRASAPEQEEDEYADEREIILEEMKELKELSAQFMHPEKPIEMDAMANGRNYFSRTSAPEQEDDDERAQILAEAAALKKLAVDYLHPEKPVEIDATASGRNYFTRASAPEQEEDEYADEREIILEEMEELKELSTQFMHPEKPIEMDATASGRNYFSRASAPEQEQGDVERAQVLAEAAALKKLAVDYLHPEKPVEMDPAASGRNYFTRASAPEQEEDEYADEREIILEEMKELEELSTRFMHPEKPIEMDATASGRNYFSRASAPEQEDDDERAQILAEAAALKKLAVDCLHPEKPVEMDPTASCRNYFTRASAPEQEEDEYSDEREIILEEMKELKELSTQFMHPEKPIEMDANASGRNYFTRASALEQDDDVERSLVIAEAAALKKLAVEYLHPEKPIQTDATACGRNYFNRASGPVTEEEEERALILEEMKESKKLVDFFLHPEKPVQVDSSACGRNYFSRASAPEQDEFDEERAQVLAEAAAFKKLAVDYLHPEVSVKTADPSACGRNYFVRPSAKGAAEHISTSGHANESGNVASAPVQNDDYGHFEMDEEYGEEIFYDMRQSIVLPLPGDSNVAVPKFQSSKISSEEEGELSRSPSSVMLFTGALEDADHPPLPTMG